MLRETSRTYAEGWLDCRMQVIYDMYPTINTEEISPDYRVLHDVCRRARGSSRKINTKVMEATDLFLSPLSWVESWSKLGFPSTTVDSDGG